MAQSLEQFGKAVVAAGLSTPDDLKSWYVQRPAECRPRDVATFAAGLVEDGLLTAYQSSVLQQGKPQALNFGNYLLVDQLGSGASGHVFKARHKTSGRMTAIKVLSTDTAQDATAVKRFEREMQAAGRLAHPNIVKTFDAGQWNGQHYLVMEYVEGRDMASVVKTQGPLDVASALRYLEQAAEGLRYAHQEGIVHRDIKPGNLLLDAQGNVRLLDLGLARFADSGDGLTATQQVMGTVDYMSPEQSADTKRADARADVYSLGATLWYFLTGKKLYEGKGVVERIMLHRSAPIPSLVAVRPEVPAWVDGLLKRMVAKSPDDRFQTMSDLLKALRRGDAAPEDGTDSAAEVVALGEATISQLSRNELANLRQARVSAEGGTAAVGPLELQIDVGGRAGPGREVRSGGARKTQSAAPAQRMKIRRRWIVAAVIGVLVAAGVGYWLFGS